MPTLRAITERPLPVELYLDAGFFVSALGDRFDYHRQCLDLLKDAVPSPTRLSTSALIFPEVTDAVLKRILGSRNDGDLLKSPTLIPDDVWVEIERVSRLLDDMIGTANVNCCKADGPVRRRARELQQTHKMRSFDAIHAATCLQRGIDDFLTFDGGFLKPLADLTLWTGADLVNRWGETLRREAGDA